MTERQMKQLRDRLIDSLTSLYHAVQADVRESTIRDIFGAEDEPRDEGDESTRLQIRDLRMSLAEGEARRAQLIEEALGRMDLGTYGECIDCSNEIEFDRLKAVPWAPRCVDCQEELEAQNRQRAPNL